MFQQFKIFQLRISLKFAVVCTAAMLFSHAAMAQFAPAPCDPNYYQSLEARAWLEAQREITQNQNLIVKPDSVLEYTCFDRHLRELADHADEMFSETTRWGGSILTTPVAQAQHMDNALDLLVSAALTAYDTNFNHNLLGGRGSTAYTPDSTISAGSAYTCDTMQTIWMEAKCMNFIDNATNDGFFDFAHYQSNSDKRFLPTACAGPGGATWQTNIDNALPAVGATTPWDFDDVTTYLNNLFPASGCGPSGSLNRVQTGLVVYDKNTTSGIRYYAEHVCLVPGCHWDPDTSSGSGTDPNSNLARGGNCVP